MSVNAVVENSDFFSNRVHSVAELVSCRISASGCLPYEATEPGIVCSTLGGFTGKCSIVSKVWCNI